MFFFFFHLLGVGEDEGDKFFVIRIHFIPQGCHYGGQNGNDLVLRTQQKNDTEKTTTTTHRNGPGGLR